MRIIVIGAGGIGTALLSPLGRYLSYQHGKEAVSVSVADGDNYEIRNRERQSFHRLGNKAVVTVEKLQEEYPQIEWKSYDEYATYESSEYMIKDGDIIFLCVDNHKTRKIISDVCEDCFSNIVLISGGNHYTDGNIQVFVKKDGQKQTLPLTSRYHPEIQRPKDNSPAEVGCEAAAAVSDPQLVFMNLTIAALMLNAFYAYTKGALKYDEAYADIVTNNVRAVSRSNQNH